MYLKFETVNELIQIERFYFFFEKICAPGHNFTGDSHNFWECVCVLDGEIRVSADESIYELKPGEVIFHSPMEFHKFDTIGESGAHLLFFAFSMEGKLADSFNKKVVALSETEQKILDLMLDYTRNTGPDCDSYYQNLRSYIYLLLLSFSEHETINKLSENFDSLVYKKAVNYMMENLNRKVSIPELAKYCNVGTTFLKNTFKKYSGLSIHKYFLNLQLRASIDLLDSGKNVTEVSMQLGFCSQSYFSAAFKREFGYKPSEFKKVVNIKE